MQITTFGTWVLLTGTSLANQRIPLVYVALSFLNSPPREAKPTGVALLPAGTRHFLPKGVSLIKPEGKYTKWNIGVA